MKPANGWKVVVILAILFVPALVYYLLSKGENKFRKLEIYGPKEAMAPKEVEGKLTYDTLYHSIPDFSFTDQHGMVITGKTMEGHIYVADFFFTSCKTICPKMSSQLERVQTKFKDHPDLKILSFSVDPETDSVPVLEGYSKKYHAIKNKWHFLTGNKDSLYLLARNGFFLAAIQDSESADEFNHSEQLVLVDKDKRIRGYYDGTDLTEVNKLMDEILVLQWEYKNK